MNGVTSAKQAARHASRGAPIVGASIGLLLSIEGIAVAFGLILLAVALLLDFEQKAVWIVVPNSSSGEAMALAGQDGDYIDGIIGALNDSIVHRY